MAKRSTPRRARGRKRSGGRTPGAPAATTPQAGAAATARGEQAGGDVRTTGGPKPRGGASAAAARREAARGQTRFGDALTVGERPQPPWHPLPLSELLILIGMIGIGVGVSR